jgi:glucose uptake protein GlcU
MRHYIIRALAMLLLIVGFVFQSEAKKKVENFSLEDYNGQNTPSQITLLRRQSF